MSTICHFCVYDGLITNSNISQKVLQFEYHKQFTKDIYPEFEFPNNTNCHCQVLVYHTMPNSIIETSVNNMLSLPLDPIFNSDI